MSMSAALFTDSQARVLRWLFGQPERSYHFSELRRLTGLGNASLQRELKRLVDPSLVLTESVGNLRCFHANPASPVYAELVALARKALGVEPLLREALQPLLPDLQAAWLYGSVAKQTDTAKSEIDVLLVGEDLSLARVLQLLTPLEQELGRKISPTCLTPAEFARRRGQPDSFVNRVLAQPVIPLLGEDLEPAAA